MSSSTKQSRRANEPAAGGGGRGGRRSRASLASSSGTSLASSAATSSTACSSRSGRDRSQLRVRIDASAKDNEGKGKPKKRCAMCKAAQNAYLKACAIPGVSLLPPPPACPHPPPPAKPKRKRAPKEHVIKKLESLRSVDNCYAADEAAAASKTSRSGGGSGGSGKTGDAAVERSASRGGGGARDPELTTGSGNRSGTARSGPSATSLAVRDRSAPAPSAVAAAGSQMPPQALPALPIFVRYNPLRGLFGGCAELADDEIDAAAAAAQDHFRLAAAASNGDRLDTLGAGRDAAGAAAALAASAAGFRSPNLDRVAERLDEGVTRPFAARPELAEIGRERVKSRSVVSVAEHRKSRAGSTNVGRETASTSGAPGSAARSPKTAKAASAKAEQTERRVAAELAASRGGAERFVQDDASAACAPATSAAASADAGRTQAARQRARAEAVDAVRCSNTPASEKDGDACKQQPSPPLSPSPPPQQQLGAPVKRERPTPARRSEVAAAAERALQPTAPTASGFVGYSDERTLGAPANYGDYRQRYGVRGASATPLAHGAERTAAAPAAVAAVSPTAKTAGQTTVAASSLATAGAPPESRKAAAAPSDAAAAQPTKTAQTSPMGEAVSVAAPARDSAPTEVAAAVFAAGSSAARQQQQSPPSLPFVDGGSHPVSGASRDCARQAAHYSSSRRRTETSAERRRRHQQQQQQEEDDDEEDDEDDDESEYSENSDTSSRDS